MFGFKLSVCAETYRLIRCQEKTPLSVRVLMSYLEACWGKATTLSVTVPALPLSFRYETRRSPSRGTLFESPSVWTAATSTLRSSAASIMKQKCWTQQWWAQRLYKSEPSIKTKEPMLKSTTPFRQVRATQQDCLGYEHAYIPCSSEWPESWPAFSSCCNEQ